MKFSILAALGAALALTGEARAATAPAAPAAPTEADWRTPDPQNVLIIDTNKGRIIVELAPEIAPLTAARVRELAHAGFYDGRSFFRVIDDFMDQTGDPTNSGRGGSTKPDLPGEFTFRRGSQTPMVVVAKNNGVEEGFIGSQPVIGQTMDLALLTADNKVSAWGTFCPGVAGMARSEVARQRQQPVFPDAWTADQSRSEIYAVRPRHRRRGCGEDHQDRRASGRSPGQDAYRARPGRSSPRQPSNRSGD